MQDAFHSSSGFDDWRLTRGYTFHDFGDGKEVRAHVHKNEDGNEILYPATAFIHPNATIHPEAKILDRAYIGSRAHLKSGTVVRDDAVVSGLVEMRGTEMCGYAQCVVPPQVRLPIVIYGGRCEENISVLHYEGYCGGKTRGRIIVMDDQVQTNLWVSQYGRTYFDEHRSFNARNLDAGKHPEIQRYGEWMSFWQFIGTETGVYYDHTFDAGRLKRMGGNPFGIDPLTVDRTIYQRPVFQPR